MLSHEEGYEKFQKLKSTFNIEIELLCLNSEFMEKDVVNQKVKSYEALIHELEKSSILKESEYHTKENPYYESSVFCSMNDFNIVFNTIKEYNVEVDIIHYKGDEYSEQDFFKEHIDVK